MPSLLQISALIAAEFTLTTVLIEASDEELRVDESLERWEWVLPWGDPGAVSWESSVGNTISDEFDKAVSDIIEEGKREEEGGGGEEERKEGSLI